MFWNQHRSFVKKLTMVVAFTGLVATASRADAGNWLKRNTLYYGSNAVQRAASFVLSRHLRDHSMELAFPLVLSDAEVKGTNGVVDLTTEVTVQRKNGNYLDKMNSQRVRYFQIKVHKVKDWKRASAQAGKDEDLAAIAFRKDVEELSPEEYSKRKPQTESHR